MTDYVRPTSLDDALAALRQAPHLVLAGGTDLYPAHVGKRFGGSVLDITALDALRGISQAADHWRIGALTTWSDVQAASLPPLFDGLKAAAREIGGHQVQNAGTLAGNLCNASPAADGVPALMALGASVELSATDGTERVPLDSFIRGNRQTALRPEQLMTAILVPFPAGPRAAGHFLKLGARRYLVISIAMVALVLEADNSARVTRARVAVGACSAVAKRLPALEAALAGARIAPNLAACATEAQLAPLAPIDDPRGSALYRREAVLHLVRRGLVELAERL